MKVEVVEVHITDTTLGAMPVGSIGATNDGRIFLRTMYGATCLNDIGATISTVHDTNNMPIRLFRDGTRITLIVESSSYANVVRRMGYNEAR